MQPRTSQALRIGTINFSKMDLTRADLPQNLSSLGVKGIPSLNKNDLISVAQTKNAKIFSQAGLSTAAVGAVSVISPTTNLLWSPPRDIQILKLFFWAFKLNAGGAYQRVDVELSITGANISYIPQGLSGFSVGVFTNQQNFEVGASSDILVDLTETPLILSAGQNYTFLFAAFGAFVAGDQIQYNITMAYKET